VHIALGRGSVLFRQGNFGVFFPIDNALYGIVFETHTKTAKPIEMPFGLMSEFDPMNSVLRGGDDPRKGRTILGKRVRFRYEGPISLNLLIYRKV